MKKIFLFYLALSCYTIFGQNVNEDFELSSLPSGWLNINNSGTPDDDWRSQGITNFNGFDFEARTGNFYFASYSNYNGFGVIPDNWLITPQITILSNSSELSFSGIGSSTFGEWTAPGEKLEVYVSTTGTNISDFTSVWSNRFNPAAVWNDYVVSLAAYEGQDVYIAFRHHDSYNEFFLGLDAISVSNAVIAGSTANNPPTAVNDASTTAFNTPITTNVLSNDSDPGGSLNPASVTVTVPSPNGTTSVNTTTGSITFTPNTGFSGTTTYTYQVCDNGSPALCATATVTITVEAAANNTPIAQNDASTTAFETAVTTNVLANDSDPDGNPLAVSIVSQSANGNAVVNGDGTITFTPNAGYSGTTTYTYQVCDNGSPALCATATVTITVEQQTQTNQAPVANNDMGSPLVQDGPNGTVNILTNDTDPDGNPSAPTNGTGQFSVDIDPITPGIQTSVISPIDGTTWTYDPATGIVTCDPPSGFTGTTIGAYTLCDPQGLCANATISFVVNPATGNNAPIAQNDASTTAFETAVTTTVLANDSDPDGNPLTVSIVTQSANGNAVVNGDGSITFTPNAGYSGTTTYTYQICDNGSPALCATATVTITVQDEVVGNQAPIAVNDVGATSFETAVTTNVLANDSDPDGDPLTVTIVSQSVNGIATVNGNGTITFTPNSGFSGTTSYTYQICDDGTPALCATATVTITVGSAGGNSAPVANDDAGTGVQNGINVSVSILLNDVDPDGNPTAFSGHTVDLDINQAGVQNTFTSSDPVATWTYNATFGTLSCDAGQDVVGTLTLVYELCDNGTPALCDQATVTVTISPSTSSIPENSLEYSLYPNPTTSVINLVSENKVSNIKIYSLEGKELLNSSETLVNVENLSNGMYYLHVTFENGASSKSSFVKQ